METMESNDSKNLLLRKSAKHKGELEQEIKIFSENTEKLVTNALIIGGTLAMGYFLVRQFSKSKVKRKAKKIKLVRESSPHIEAAPVTDTSEPSVVSQIGSAIAAQATVFLLDLAKDKLSDFLKARFEKKDETPA